MKLWLRIALPVGFFAALLILWEISVRAFGIEANAPYPSAIALAGARSIADGVVIIALLGSLQRVLIGFSIGALIGLPVGTAFGLFPPLQRAAQPITDSLRSIAPIAWIPLAILWLGVRGNAALFIVAYSAVFPFIISAAQAARTVDPRLILAAHTLGANKLLMLRAVVVPSMLPQVFTGARIAMAIGWSSIIAAELAVGIKVAGGGRSVAGLGQLMVETLYVRRDMNALVFFMLIIGLTSFLIDYGLRSIQRKFFTWTNQ